MKYVDPDGKFVANVLGAFAAAGLATGAVSIKTNKFTPFKTQTVTQSTKQARAKAHANGKSFTREQYKKNSAKTQKANKDKQTMNKTVTNYVQQVGGAIDGVLQGGYEKAKRWLGFGD